jgi:hypothetical protein
MGVDEFEINPMCSIEDDEQDLKEILGILMDSIHQKLNLLQEW